MQNTVLSRQILTVGFVENNKPHMVLRHVLQANGGGIRRSGGVSEVCEKHDPCQHGGICISTDNGPKCQCRDKNFEGTYCEKGTFENSI